MKALPTTEEANAGKSLWEIHERWPETTEAWDLGGDETVMEARVFFLLPELILWPGLTLAAPSHPDLVLTLEERTRLHCLLPDPSGWLWQQGGNMVAGEVRPPTLDQPPVNMGHLETEACKSGRIISQKEKKNPKRFGGEEN